jgi:hypothetical protein
MYIIQEKLIKAATEALPVAAQALADIAQQMKAKNALQLAELRNRTDTVTLTSLYEAELRDVIGLPNDQR